MSRCTHKTQADHGDWSGEKFIWVCSHCQWVSWWTDSWGYLGNWQCMTGGTAYRRGCGFAQVDLVWCSDECRDALAANNKELAGFIADES